MLPEILEIMGNQPKYNGAYKVKEPLHISKKLKPLFAGMYLFMTRVERFPPPLVFDKISSFV